MVHTRHIRIATAIVIGCIIRLSSVSAQQPHIPKIIVDRVQLEGAPDLPKTAREQLVQAIKEQHFEGGSDKWVEKLNDTVLNRFDQSDSEQRAIVCTGWHRESEDSAGVHVSVTISVSEAPARTQLQLSSVSFKGATAFPQDQLRALVPLKDGNVVTTYGVRAGLAAISRLYRANGYPEAVITTEMRFDDTHQTESIVFVVEEGRK